MAKTRIKTKSVDGGAWEVLALASHPMETGQRTDPSTKQKIPAHWIQKMTVTHNGKVVATADMGVAVSKNPVIGVRLKGAKPGDKVVVSWTDNKGENDTAETTVGA
jgi:sulfur-oxidizing protein SoxZ